MPACGAGRGCECPTQAGFLAGRKLPPARRQAPHAARRRRCMLRRSQGLLHAAGGASRGRRLAWYTASLGRWRSWVQVPSSPPALTASCHSGSMPPSSDACTASGLRPAGSVQDAPGRCRLRGRRGARARAQVRLRRAPASAAAAGRGRGPQAGPPAEWPAAWHASPSSPAGTRPLQGRRRACPPPRRGPQCGAGWKNEPPRGGGGGAWPAAGAPPRSAGNAPSSD